MGKPELKGDEKVVAYIGFGTTVIVVDSKGNWHPQTFGFSYTNLPQRHAVRLEEEALKHAPAMMRALKPLAKLGLKMGHENCAEPVDR